jgi:hypothetical protein
MTKRRALLWTLGGVLAGVVEMLSVAVVVFAQEPLVFPILYGGTAYVDGQPAPAGTVLIAKVGDWPNSTTVERNGTYHGLLVSPPTKEYYYRPITFHLGEMTAQEQDVFLPAGEPTFKDSGYDLHFSRAAQPAATPTPSSTFLPATTPTAQRGVTPVSVTPALPHETPGRAPTRRDGPGMALAIAGVGALTAVGVGWYVSSRRRGR